MRYAPQRVALATMVGLAVPVLTGCATPRPAIGDLPTPPLSDCGLESPGRPLDLDVAIAVDLSGSTGHPSGVDIDGDGRIGVFEHGMNTDLGDSLLSAEVAAIKTLATQPALRLAIVGYADRDRFDDPPGRIRGPEIVRYADLTASPADIAGALDRILRRGSRGTAGFSPAIRTTVALLDLSTEDPATRPRAILLIADSPVPVRPGPSQYYYRSYARASEGVPGGSIVRSDPDMYAAAKRAIRSRIPIHTFGLGPAAETPTPHALSRIANATGGRFHAVTDPARLHCELLAALASPAAAPVAPEALQPERDF